MKTIVITGSTRGIGLGMAGECLKMGCKVVVSGRSQASVDKALASLRDMGYSDNVIGVPCDVGNIEQVQNLWDKAVEAFGQVDIWLNNAALNNAYSKLWEVDPDEMQAIVNANIIGTWNGCRVAIQGMTQQGHGHLYTVEGSGSGGEIRAGTTPYGMTKYAIAYMDKALRNELKGSPVKISTMSPGMVTTDMLKKSIDPSRVERVRSLMNILADRVETVSPWLAEKIVHNDKYGARIAWLNTWQILGRFLSSPFRKRDVMRDSDLPAPKTQETN
jgi:NAD(P)-dependent dehydrogenase (short-subunit alcohol dehydrogenase family)